MGPLRDTPLWTRGYVTNLTATFAFWFNVDFLLLALPLYLRSADFSASAIGLIFGAAAPAAIVARLLSGRRIDRTGGRNFLLGGAAAWAVGSAAMAFTDTFSLLMLLRFMQGAGLGVFTNASLAYVSYSAPTTRRDEALGWWAATTPTMAMLAPVVAAFVALRFGFTAAFLVAAAAGGVATLAGLLLPRLEYMPLKPSTSYRPYVPAALLPGLFGGAIAVASGSFAAFAPLLAADRGVDNVGLILTCSALGSILVRFVAGPLATRKGRAWVVVPGLILAASALILLGTTSTATMLFAAPFLFGIGTGAAMPGLLSWAVARAGEAERATAGGTFYAFFEVGLFIGAPLLGVVVERIGFVAFVLPALLLLLSLVAYLVVTR
jgi:MFS family permease